MNEVTEVFYIPVPIGWLLLITIGYCLFKGLTR